MEAGSASESIVAFLWSSLYIFIVKGMSLQVLNLTSERWEFFVEAPCEVSFPRKIVCRTSMEEKCPTSEVTHGGLR